MSFEYPGLSRYPIATLVMYWVDVVLTILFGIEVLVKVEADGIKTYLQEVAN